MIKNYFFLFLTVFFAGPVYAQMNQGSSPVIDQHGNLREKRVQPLEAIGSVYLNEDWKVATLYLFPRKLSVDTLKETPIKFDIKANEFDINAQNKTKVIEGSKVQKFDWLDPNTGNRETFVNCNKFTYGQSKLSGFCKVTPGSNIQLATHTFLTTMKADYNVALDVGSKSDRIVQETKLYFIKDNKMYDATKKNLYTLMPEKQAEIKKYIKDNDVSFSSEEDLNVLVEYCDSIF